MGSRHDAHGGADRKAIKRIVKQVAKEKKRRALYADKRKAVLGQNLKPAVQARRLAKLRWAVVSKSDPGVFLGTVGGIRGYWRPPVRMLAPERNDLIAKGRSRKYHRSTGSAHKSRLSWNKPGSHLELLVALTRKTKYKKRFDYNRVVAEFFAQEMTPEKLASSLAYYRNKHIMLNGG